MSEDMQDDLYAALLHMIAAKQAAADALRCLIATPDIDDALLHRMMQCEALLAGDLPAADQVHRVIDLVTELRQVAAINSQAIYLVEEGCVSGGYERIVRSSYCVICRDGFTFGVAEKLARTSAAG